MANGISFNVTRISLTSIGAVEIPLDQARLMSDVLLASIVRQGGPPEEVACLGKSRGN